MGKGDEVNCDENYYGEDYYDQEYYDDEYYDEEYYEEEYYDEEISDENENLGQNVNKDSEKHSKSKYVNESHNAQELMSAPVLHNDLTTEYAGQEEEFFIYRYGKATGYKLINPCMSENAVKYPNLAEVNDAKEQLSKYLKSKLTKQEDKKFLTLLSYEDMKQYTSNGENISDILKRKSETNVKKSVDCVDIADNDNSRKNTTDTESTQIIPGSKDIRNIFSI